jgi:hypothetical protein
MAINNSAGWNDFRKSGLYTKGSLGGNIKLPYQDPTYLTFGFMFVESEMQTDSRDSSPLLAGAAERFLEKLKNTASAPEKYALRLQNLKDFKSALMKINKEMPWYWQSLKGLDRLQQYDPNRPYWGGDEAKLTIECLESINLAITGLMSLYKKAVFDEEKWSYIIPANLRKFSMYVYVSEIRNIDIGSYVNNPNFNDQSYEKDENINVDIAAKNIPQILFRLDFCEFDMSSGSMAISDLSATSPEHAKQEIVIKYEKMQEVNGVYLNGVITQVPDKITERNIPTVEVEVPASGLQSRLNGIADQASTSLKNFSESKKQEILGAVTGAINDRIPTPENVIMNAVRGLDEATKITQKGIEEAILGNVYGANPGDKIIEALQRGGINGLGNVYK